MTQINEPNSEGDVSREHISKLCRAILRINENLELDTVLNEVVDNARSLTKARFGVIATIDDLGAPPEFVVSGMSSGEKAEIKAWPDVQRLFEHLRSLDGPIRLSDFSEYIGELGFAGGLPSCKTFLGTPMRHRGLDVGGFFLGTKESGESFTDEDELVLELFAAQAAIAIANARTHREEKRARADLEVLVDTSPVGVVMFDATTGAAKSLNREAKRIVSGLLGPNGSFEELLEVTTSRLADGSEVSLDDLREAKTLRAAEVELSVPDGRRIRMLVNATPIFSDDDEVESVIVTMQDFAALEELQRLRVKFLGMVSHELRAPLAAIRGSAVTLLEEAGQLDGVETREFHRIIVDETARMRRVVSDLLDAGRIESGSLSVNPEPRDIGKLIERAQTTFLSSTDSHALIVDLEQDLPLVMADDHRVEQVLGNLLANADRHSPKSAPIHVRVAREGIDVAISVVDEGPSIPAEQLRRLFVNYEDRDERELGFGGFGLGLIVCRGLVEAHGGRIRAESNDMGYGTRITFTLPVAGDGLVGSGSSELETRSNLAKNEPATILVVDDDLETLRLARDALVGAGYVATITGDPDVLPDLLRHERPSLVLLDLVLAGTDGIELMETVPELEDVPVIFISAYGRDEEIVKVLDGGADDYIVKPFSPTELTARVRAVLRRRAGGEPFVLRDLVIDYEQRLVSIAGQSLKLTRIEYDLLRVLSLNAGRVVTYASLLRQVWTKSSSGDTMRVRDFVKKLRRKLGDDVDKPLWIFNERGVGYRMPKPGED